MIFLFEAAVRDITSNAFLITDFPFSRTFSPLAMQPACCPLSVVLDLNQEEHSALLQCLGVRTAPCLLCDMRLWIKQGTLYFLPLVPCLLCEVCKAICFGEMKGYGSVVQSVALMFSPHSVSSDSGWVTNIMASLFRSQQDASFVLVIARRALCCKTCKSTLFTDISRCQVGCS